MKLERDEKRVIGLALTRFVGMCETRKPDPDIEAAKRLIARFEREVGRGGGA